MRIIKPQKTSYYRKRGETVSKVTLIQLLILFKCCQITVNVDSNQCLYMGITGRFIDDENRCILYIKQMREFLEAIDYCASHGLGKLLEPRDRVTEMNAEAYMNEVAQALTWVGSRWDSEARKWRWVSDDKTLEEEGFSPWGDIIPEILGESVICMARAFTGNVDSPKKWNSLPCNTKMNFVCDSKACPPMTFNTTGTDCTPCRCADKELCDSYDGNCTSGCEEGFYGHSCHKRVCPKRTYDPPTCNKVCRCLSDVPCNPATGVCPNYECDQDWNGTYCNQTVCPPEKWGPKQDCEFDCVCSGSTTCRPSTGECPVYTCTGEWGGPTCTENVCRVGFFSPPACNKTCFCKNRERCDPKTGICKNGCDSAHTGTTCTKTICPEGYWGPPKCRTQCHCLFPNDCNAKTGKCLRGCAKGYNGTATCNRRLCLPTYYGFPDCQKRCYCAQEDCNVNTGICIGPCKAGYYGKTCSEVLQVLRAEKTYGGKYTLWVIFLVVLGIYVAITFVCIIPSNIKRKEERGPTDQLESNSVTDVLARILANHQIVAMEKRNQEMRQWARHS